MLFGNFIINLIKPSEAWLLVSQLLQQYAYKTQFTNLVHLKNIMRNSADSASLNTTFT